MNLIKKSLSYLLAVVILTLSMTPALAAAKATATTMQLQSKSGTVTITKSTGKEVKYKAGMKLYSGYTVTTGSESYANISLDGSKVLKIDSSSSVSVSKSGKKLNLFVNSGSAFFNVSKKLDGDESMNIQTSTMTAGIRGTSGIVSTGISGGESSYGSRIMLLEGSVTLQCSVDSKVENYTVSAGEKFSILPTGNAAPQVEPITASAIPGFVAVEVAADPYLQKRIEADGKLLVEDIIKDASTRLAQEEKEKADKLSKLEETIKDIVVKPPVPVPSSGNGGSTIVPKDNYEILKTENDAPVVVESGIWSTLNAPRALKEGEYLRLLGSVGSSSTPAKEYALSQPDARLYLNGYNLYTDLAVSGGLRIACSDDQTAKSCSFIGSIENIETDDGLQPAKISVIAANATIDLAGKDLKGLSFSTDSQAKLSIIDSSEEKSGSCEAFITNEGVLEINANISSVDEKRSVIENMGALIMNGGTISCDSAAATVVLYGGSFIMNGGTISNSGTSSAVSTGEETDAYFVFNGGILSATGARAFTGETAFSENAAATLVAETDSTPYVMGACRKGSGNTSIDTLISAVVPELENTITLNADCETKESLTLGENTGITLTGNGSTLYYTGEDAAAFVLGEGSSSTFYLENVTVSSKKDATILNAQSGSVILRGVSLIGNGDGKPVLNIGEAQISALDYDNDSIETPPPSESDSAPIQSRIINNNASGITVSCKNSENSENSKSLVGDIHLYLKASVDESMYGETTDEKLSNFLKASASSILSRLIDGTLSGISENAIGIESLDGTPYWHIAISSVTSQ